ncbi:methyltransferase-like protein 13 [Tanacetum coccineum]
MKCRKQPLNKCKFPAPRLLHCSDISTSVDWSVLVDKFSTLVVGGLSLVSKHLYAIGKQRDLCLGLGAGFLAKFMSDKLIFDVVGVEWDETVHELAGGLFKLNKFSIELGQTDASSVVSEFAKHGVVGGGRFEEIHKGVSVKFQVLGLDINSPDNEAMFPKHVFSMKSFGGEHTLKAALVSRVLMSNTSTRNLALTPFLCISLNLAPNSIMFCKLAYHI